jgi:hypothetical protein
MSEEKQGQHIVEASVEAGVECFLWSTLPSSREISGGKFVTRLYEGSSRQHILRGHLANQATVGKQSVDAVIRDAGLKGAFIRTGNFYENMISRKYAAYDKENDVITMTRPIIGPDAERELALIFLANLYTKSLQCSHFALRREGPWSSCQSTVRPVGGEEGYS